MSPLPVRYPVDANSFRDHCSMFWAHCSTLRQLQEPKPRVTVKHVWDAKHLAERAESWGDTVPSTGLPAKCLSAHQLLMREG